ncbi:MAG: 5'-3' exonuclease [Steroidobacterales bacterium]
MIYLVDASYFVFRAYYSMPPSMADADGNSTHALYGFARFLGDLIEEVRPAHIAIAFDESLETSFRNKIYPAYKANREPAPEDLKRQFELCRELCVHLGLAGFSSDEYEADDIIGTLAVRMRERGHRSTLVTRDKDLSQLVRDGDIYWDYSGREKYHYHDIAERFGVVPERMADYLALTGDSVDNIAGVPGIGPKTAAVIFGEFLSLEHLYENLERVPALKVRGAARLPAKLREHRDAAFLARRLTAIACDMPIVAGLADLARRPPDIDALQAFYDRQKFGAMLRRQAERLAGVASA